MYKRQDSNWLDFYDFSFENSNYDHTANFCIKALTVERTMPELAIESISGGIGAKAIIKNCGECNAENIEWTITVDGGLMGFVHKENTGVITELAIDQKTEVNVGPFFGFGPITITITAEIPGVPLFTEQAEGRVIFFFSKIT